VSSFANEDKRWVGTWAAPVQPVWGSELPFDTQVPMLDGPCRIRQQLRCSVAGSSIRVVFSNEYGSSDLVLGETRIAVSANTVDVSVWTTITFKANAQVTIPAGCRVTSDELPLTLAALDLVELDTQLEWPTEGMRTFHWDARETTTLVAEQGATVHETTARLLVCAIEVVGVADQSAVAVVGDSIVNGFGIDKDSFSCWVDVLTQRAAPWQLAVLNLGQSGSKLSGRGLGVDTLSRFERDGLAQAGLGAVIVQAGLNDLGWPQTVIDPDGGVPAAPDIIGAYQQLIGHARKRGVKVIGCTLSPYKGAFEGTPFKDFWSPIKEQIRQQVNAWLRSSGTFDAVIDVDLLLRDPNDHQRLSEAYDCGDHLHPNVLGSSVIAASVQLESLR
jgi:lysophospholipase L1-like esterase